MVNRFVILSYARCGTSFLMDLFREHPDVAIIPGEPLNPEHLKHESEEQTFALLEERFSSAETSSKTFIGLKIMVDQVHTNRIDLTRLFRALQVNACVVLSRESIIELFLSLRTAQANNQWYGHHVNPLEKVHFTMDEFSHFSNTLSDYWRQMARDLPIECRPIFVTYEQLHNNTAATMNDVTRLLGLSDDEGIRWGDSLSIVKQNPYSVEDRLEESRWTVADIERLKAETSDVRKIFRDAMQSKVGLSDRSFAIMPDREPPPPPTGWVYPVAKPFIAPSAGQYVTQAVDSGNVSSVNCWVRKMAKILMNLFKVPVAQPCCNGYSALVLALQAARVGEGDRVLVPTFTMIAVSNAVLSLRAVPVFVDCAAEDYNPSVVDYAAKASEDSSQRIKAVIVAHTYGVPARDIEKIATFCQSSNYVLIEDISECVGVRTSEGKLLGTFGQYASASMYANKIVHGGDAGFVISTDIQQAYPLRSLVNHGFTGSFHFVHFEQAINAKINGLGAPLACSSLEELEGVIKYRSDIAAQYRDGLKDLVERGLLTLMPPCGQGDTPWVFGLCCNRKQGVTRNPLREYLARYGIETRNYFFPLHLQPMFKDRHEQFDSPDFPVSETLAAEGFYLPTYHDLKSSDIRYICQAINQFFEDAELSVAVVPPPLTTKALPSLYWTLNGLKVLDSSSGSLSSSNHVLLDLADLMQKFVSYKKSFEWSLGQEIKNYILNEFSLRCAEFSLDCEQLSTRFRLKEKLRLIDYLQSFEPARLSLSVPMKDLSFDGIPTTSDERVFECLAGLLSKHRPKRILDVGTLFGASAIFIAKQERDSEVYSVDSFKWYPFMQHLLKGFRADVRIGDSFYHIPAKNIEEAGLKDRVHLIEMDLLSCESLPLELNKLTNSLDFVFSDFTRDLEAFINSFRLLKALMIPNQTILFLNGFGCSDSFLPVLHPDVAAHLRPLYKPQDTFAAAFLYVDESHLLSSPKEEVMTLPGLHFLPPPDWKHHHNDAFSSAYNFVKSQLHHDEASDVLFVPAVEVCLCDDLSLRLSRQPWIGIVHSIPHTDRRFVPDLHRLCHVADYQLAMDKCLGLFALTTVQAKYLRRHLPRKVPVSLLTYPFPTSLSPQIMDVANLPATDNARKRIERGQLVQIGMYQRDLSWFFQVKIPPSFRKILFAGNESDSIKAPSSVEVRGRVNDAEYEATLANSIVCLAMLGDGAANTIIMECIQRNVPVIAPRIQSVVDYLGENYPLYYEPRRTSDIQGLLEENPIKEAIAYLQSMDKNRFSQQRFLRDISRSSVMIGLPTTTTTKEKEEDKNRNVSVIDPFDRNRGERELSSCFNLTVSICSYRRTHNLSKILKSLFDDQQYDGRIEIIIWNNNHNRMRTVQEICAPFIARSNHRRSLKVIQSSENYYCSIRLALSSLMRSPYLLICDDDIQPRENFVSFFMNAAKVHPDSVLGVRGHLFSPHLLNEEDPVNEWTSFCKIRFVDDCAPEQELHFIHADACLIPLSLLRKASSVAMPDPTFALVDDYWFSFVLSAYFQVPLIKLEHHSTMNAFHRVEEDAEDVNIALHKRSEVLRARYRLYVHHMVQGWPFGPSISLETTLQRDSDDDNRAANSLLSSDEAKITYSLESGSGGGQELRLREMKLRPWQRDSPHQYGVNAELFLTLQEIQVLMKMGVTIVRLGAVGTGDDQSNGSSCLKKDFIRNPIVLNELSRTLQMLKEYEINVILTLPASIASEEAWRTLAVLCRSYGNVVGYDLMNEPTVIGEDELLAENELNWEESLTGVKPPSDVIRLYQQFRSAVRDVDTLTPLILEPARWGHYQRLPALLKGLQESQFLCDEPNCVISFHFYSPIRLTTRRQTAADAVSYPGEISTFAQKTELWDANRIQEIFSEIVGVCERFQIPRERILLGEFGIRREVRGAAQYLKDVAEAAVRNGFTCLWYAFRERTWGAMNYELGDDVTNITLLNVEDNALLLPLLACLRHRVEDERY